MNTIIMGVDENRERVKAQIETIKDLPFDRDSVEITIIHILSDNPEGASASQIWSVRHAAEELEEAGFSVEMKASAGSPSAVLTSVAENQDARLISVAGRKRSPSGKAIFGSTSQSVLLGTDIPVLVSGKSSQSH